MAGIFSQLRDLNPDLSIQNILVFLYCDGALVLLMVKAPGTGGWC
jgi:hypothetical protein